MTAETNSHAKWLRQVAEEARSGFPRFYSWANTCDEAADEIERLENIQRDFHNLDDVAEIRRLREVLIRLRDEPAQDEAWDMDDVHTLVLQALAGGRAHDTGSLIDVGDKP